MSRLYLNIYSFIVINSQVPNQNVSDQESWVHVELANGKHVNTRLLIGNFHKFVHIM